MDEEEGVWGSFVLKNEVVEERWYSDRRLVATMATKRRKFRPIVNDIAIGKKEFLVRFLLIWFGSDCGGKKLLLPGTTSEVVVGRRE